MRFLVHMYIYHQLSVSCSGVWDCLETKKMCNDKAVGRR